MGWFSIRMAQAADRDVVAALVRDAYSKYVSRIGREPAPVSADYASLIAQHGVWVADAAGDVVGVLVLKLQDDALLLENVAVAPAYQRRGVGRALIAFAEGHSRSLGLSEVRVYTNEQMTENIRFYPRLGYLVTGRKVEDGFARVYFRKFLS